MIQMPSLILTYSVSYYSNNCKLLCTHGIGKALLMKEVFMCSLLSASENPSHSSAFDIRVLPLPPPPSHGCHMQGGWLLLTSPFKRDTVLEMTVFGALSA